MPDDGGPPQETTEPPLMLVSIVAGQLEKGKFASTYQIPKDVKTQDLGDWEYVFVAKVPSLDLSTTSTNTLNVSFKGPRLRLNIELDPDDPTAVDEIVTLDGSDGYSQTLKIISEGKLHAHKQGFTTVIFDGVKAGGVKYTCTVDPKSHGPMYKLFEDMELKQDQLLPPEGEGGGDAPAQPAPAAAAKK